MKLGMPKLPDPSSMSRRERLMAMGSALVVVAVILDRAVMGPWWQHTRRVREDIHRLELSITTHDRLLSRKDQIDAKGKLYEDYIGTERPGVLDMASLIREIESVGKDSGITLGEVKPLEGAELGQAFIVEVQYQGSMEQWMQFLYLLQTSKSLLTIERASAQKQENSPDQLEGAVRISSQARRVVVPHARFDGPEQSAAG